MTRPSEGFLCFWRLRPRTATTKKVRSLVLSLPPSLSLPLPRLKSGCFLPSLPFSPGQFDSDAAEESPVERGEKLWRRSIKPAQKALCDSAAGRPAGSLPPFSFRFAIRVPSRRRLPEFPLFPLPGGRRRLRPRNRSGRYMVLVGGRRKGSYAHGSALRRPASRPARPSRARLAPLKVIIGFLVRSLRTLRNRIGGKVKLGC